MAELQESLVIVDISFIYPIFKPIVPHILPENKIDEIVRQIIDRMDAEAPVFTKALLELPNYALIGEYDRNNVSQIREAVHRLGMELYIGFRNKGLFIPSYDGDDSKFPYVFEHVDLKLGNLLLKYYGEYFLTSQPVVNPLTGRSF